MKFFVKLGVCIVLVVGVFSAPRSEVTVEQIKAYIAPHCGGMQAHKVLDNVRRLRGALQDFDAKNTAVAFETFQMLAHKYVPDQVAELKKYHVLRAIGMMAGAVAYMQGSKQHAVAFKTLKYHLKGFVGFNTLYALLHSHIFLNCSEQLGGGVRCA